MTAEEFLYENGFDGYHDNALVFITKENKETEHCSKIMVEFAKRCTELGMREMAKIASPFGHQGMSKSEKELLEKTLNNIQ